MRLKRLYRVEGAKQSVDRACFGGGADSRRVVGVVSRCSIARGCLRFGVVDPHFSCSVLKRARFAPRGVVTDTGSVALRVPSHGVALSLLRAFGRAIAAPSANLSGCVSATRAEHVISAFSGSEEPALVLDSSDVCEAGIESTVVSFMGSGEGCVLRLGAVSVAEMEEVLGEKLSRVGDRDGDERGVSCRLSPGLSGRHYAPRLPLRLNALGRLERGGRRFLGFGGSCEEADM